SVLYRRFFTGIDIPGLDGDLSPTTIAFRWILGGDGADFTGKVSGLPGAVQLMPSGLYPPPAWNQSLAPPATIYDLYDSPPAPPGLDSSGLSNAVEAELAARLVEVKQFHTLRPSATD